MTESFREAIEAVERAVTGGSVPGQESLARMMEGLDLAQAGTEDRAYLAVLLDWLGLHGQAAHVLQGDDGGNVQGTDTADGALRNLEGILVASRGQYIRAIELFEEALIAAPDGTSLHTKVLVNLATACLQVGRLTQADSWVARAKEARAQAGDPAVDILLASVQAGRARIENDLANLRTATSALGEAAKSRIAQLGANHPQALMALSNMATTEFELACAEDSYERQERAVAVLEVAARRLSAELGADHPQALVSMANLCAADLTLARADGSAQRLEPAVVALETVSRRLAAVLGADHPHAQLVAANLASLKQETEEESARFASDKARAETHRIIHEPSQLQIGRAEPVRVEATTGSAIQGGTGGGGMLTVEPGGGPTVLRILLGSQLRRLRETRGITREDAGYTIRASGSKISRMELGRVRFKERDVVDLLKMYGVTDETERATLLALATETNSPGWWHRYSDILPDWFQVYAGLEEAAALIRLYEVQFVPGLLQTADYARAVVRLDQPGAAAEEIERRVSLRVARQELLSKPDAPRLWAVMDEAALRRPIGGKAVMRAQLDRLIEVTKEPNITLQVVPFSSGGHASAGGAFTILQFPEPELPGVVYVEQLTGSQYLDKRYDVERYTKKIERLSVESASPERTIRILRAMKNTI